MAASQFASVFCRGVTAAACIIVANTIGSGDRAALLPQKRYFQRLSVALGLGAGAIILLVRPFMLQIYNVGELTLEYAAQIMLIEAGVQVFRYFQLMNMMGILRGGGDVGFAMLNDLVFLWAFTVPAGFVAGMLLRWPVAAVYLIIKLDQLIKVFTSEARLRGGRWLHDTTKTGEAMP
jgi:Na+-driven multidrug efflux pump